MLVDDHQGFRRVVKSLLHSGEMAFAECATGEEAVELYRRFEPDLVLMDIAMEGIDGITATNRIKKLFPSARIFILTQYDDADLREAAWQAGARGYLLKDDLSQVQALFCVPPEVPDPPQPGTRIRPHDE